MTESGLAKSTLGCRAVGGWNRAQIQTLTLSQASSIIPRDPRCWPRCSRATGTQSCSPGSLQTPPPKPPSSTGWSGRRWARKTGSSASALRKPGLWRCPETACRPRATTASESAPSANMAAAPTWYSTGLLTWVSRSCQPRLSVAVPEVMPSPSPFLPSPPPSLCYMPSTCQPLPSARPRP